MKQLPTPSIPDGGTLSWESQVVQYPEVGVPGISYYRGEVSTGFVDCLLWRDQYGHVRGVLNHYPKDFPPWETKGNVNVFIDPTARRQGIATALLQEALTRWDIDFHKQRYTPSGIRLVQSLGRL